MKKYMSCVITAILGVTAVVSQGDVGYTWTGGTDGDWSNTVNWVSGTLPQTTGGMIYSEDSNTSIITIQNGANMPASNIPTYANNWFRTPHYVVEAGASFAVAQGGGYNGPTGAGTIATVGSGATLTMTGSNELQLMRDGDGRQSYNVNGGTLNFVADRVDLGFNNARFSDFNLDAGNVVFTHKTWGLGAKINVYGSRGGNAYDDVNQSKVTLQNGSSFLINGKFAGNMDDSGDADAAVVFDLQDIGDTLTFQLDGSSAFTTLAEVEAGEGTYWTSSILGDDKLAYSQGVGDYVTVSVVPEPATLGLVVIMGAGLIATRRNFRS